MIRMVKHTLLCALGALVVFSACATTARAQGSRKDDIVFNAQGHPMAGASVRVCTSAATGQPCTPLAQIYSDPALTQALANPTSTDGLGNYNFYAAPGRYMIEISGPGITTKQIPNVVLPSDPSTPTFTTVTTTSGISAFSLSLTGNLTVNGSTAVAGSLSVGGLPVPGSNQDNQWTAGQRFKGPIPWRDISGYMPAGGCSSILAPVDPPTTGTISSGSSGLTLGNARDFKNGCGIAVVGAGPASTIGSPNQACSISSITRSSNVVTVTCAAAHNIPTGAFDHFQGIQITGVADSSYNGTFDVTGVADTTHFTYNQTGANSSSSSGTATMQFGYAHGLTGATTYNYKVSAVDVFGGMSAASPSITITTGNATLTTSNYNWINFGVASTVPAQVPHEWVIYSDKGLGGAYSCVGVSFTNAYSDFGLPMPCPVFAPATPPASATAQVLNAIINGGGGTTSLTLSVAASNTATTQNVYHDESTFLNSCVNDDLADRTAAGFPGSPGAYGCYIPAGNYFLNGQLATDNVAASGTTIWVAGSVFLNIFPWYVTQGQYSIKGNGESGVHTNFNHSTTSYVHVSTSLGAAFVLRPGAATTISGLAIPGFAGHGIWGGQVPYLGSPSSYRFDDDILQASAIGGGAPLVFDQNVIGAWINNSTFVAASTGGRLPSIYITATGWNSSANCCVYFNDIDTAFRGVKFDMPGGNGTGGGHNSFYFNNWINENLGGAELGMIVHDTGPNAPGAASSVGPLNTISVHNLNNSDPINGTGAYTLFTEIGSSLSINTVDVNAVNSFGGMLSCGPNTTVCNDRPGVGNNLFSTGSSVLGGSWGNQLQVQSGLFHVEMPILSKLAYTGYGQTPANPAWAEVLPAPNQFSITGTGAGSLAAATYCMAVEGKDAQATPGLTLPTNTLCQAVGASSSISLQWNQASGNLNQAYNGFRFLYCSTGGSSCVPNNYIPDLAAGGNPYAYAFTSTAGSTATSLNTISTAYLSWLYWDRGTKSCLFCTSTAGSSLWQLGIGEGNPAAGVKVAVAGGTLQGEGGIQAGADVAFNASPRGSYNAFLPNLTSTAATYQRMTLDKAVTVTRLQLVLGTAGAGCTTQSTVSVTDGTSSVTLTTANGTATYDTGAVSQNFTAAANLDIKIATAASGCTTAPQNANVNVQYRMQ
jgi:hypothetical protein